MRKAIMLAFCIGIFLFHSSAYAVPGKLTGALNFNWYASVNEVKQGMRNRENTEKITEKTDKIEKAVLNTLTYKTSFSGENSLVYFSFVNDGLYFVSVIIPATNEQILRKFDDFQSVISTKYGNVDKDVGQGYTHQSTWFFTETKGISNDYIACSIRPNPFYGFPKKTSTNLYYFSVTPNVLLIQYSLTDFAEVARLLQTDIKAKDI